MIGRQARLRTPNALETHDANRNDRNQTTVATVIRYIVKMNEDPRNRRARRTRCCAHTLLYLKPTVSISSYVR